MARKRPTQKDFRGFWTPIPDVEIVYDPLEPMIQVPILNEEDDSAAKENNIIDAALRQVITFRGRTFQELTFIFHTIFEKFKRNERRRQYNILLIPSILDLIDIIRADECYYYYYGWGSTLDLQIEEAHVLAYIAKIIEDPEDSDIESISGDNESQASSSNPSVMEIDPTSLVEVVLLSSSSEGSIDLENEVNPTNPTSNESGQESESDGELITLDEWSINQSFSVEFESGPESTDEEGEDGFILVDEWCAKERQDGA